MLHGKLVSLRAVEKEDYEQIKEWLTEPDLLYLLGARLLPMSTIDPDKLPELFRMRDGRVQSIVTRDRGLVGLAVVGNFHEFNRTAQIMILIGDRSEWNRGYGSDAIRGVVKFAFDELNLNCVEAIIPAFNQRAQRVFEKVGFSVEGRLRSRFFGRGQFRDIIVVSAVRDGWNGERVGGAVVPAEATVSTSEPAVESTNGEYQSSPPAVVTGPIPIGASTDSSN